MKRFKISTFAFIQHGQRCMYDLVLQGMFHMFYGERGGCNGEGEGRGRVYARYMYNLPTILLVDMPEHNMIVYDNRNAMFRKT